MKKLLPEKLYAVATWNGSEWIIIRLSIHTTYIMTKKFIEDNYDWIKDKEYIIVEYEAK